MGSSIEKIIENIKFSMKMEDMPLTVEDIGRLRGCLSGRDDINVILRETIRRHSLVGV